MESPPGSRYDASIFTAFFLSDICVAIKEFRLERVTASLFMDNRFEE